MNVTPEVLERLRRLARSLQNKESTKTNEDNDKKEVEQKGKDNEKVNLATNGTGLSASSFIETISSKETEAKREAILNGVNGKDKEVTSPSTNQRKDEGEKKMDVNVFHQILKDVIIKRTLAVEKKLMRDVDSLKRQVTELEAQKKRLQFDSERLQKTLNDISSKQEKKNEQMISCGTQVDMDLLQERPLSPEISKPIKLISFSGKSVSSIRTHPPEIVDARPAATIDSEKMVGEKTELNRESLEDVKIDGHKRTIESRVPCNNLEVNTARHIPVVAEVDSGTSDGSEIEISICNPSEAQRIVGESSATQGNQNGKQMRQYQPQVAPPNPSTHPPHPELGFEVLFVRQQQGNMAQQSPRLDMPQPTQTHRRQPLGPRIQGVSSANSPVGHQRYLPNTLTEPPRPRRSQLSSSKWVSSQQQQHHQQARHVVGPGDVSPQSLPLSNRGPSQQVNHSSGAGAPRVPPNMSPLHPSKRRRVENRKSSDGLRMHVVSSNSNYVMHNFKVQKTPWASVERSRQNVLLPGHLSSNQVVYTNSPSNPAASGPLQISQVVYTNSPSNLAASGPLPTSQVVYTNSPSNPAASGPLPTSQVVYTNSPSNPAASRPLPTSQAVYTNGPSNPSDQLPATFVSQGVQNGQPANHPGQCSAPNRPPAGLSQGHLVERVLYPSTVSQPGRGHSGPSVMPANPNRHMEIARGTNRPVEPNVVQEYQVTQNRGALVQAIAPAPPAVQRNIVCPPVQSPGISSTASPLGYRPGDPNAGHVPRSCPNKPETSVLTPDLAQVNLKSPPKPTASIVVVQDGIVLSWNLQLEDNSAKIDNYELFACQDGTESTNPPIMWKKIGIVKALPLPMACTLTQFSAGNKYHFAVRAVDDQERAGPFSDPCTISLTT